MIAPVIESANEREHLRLALERHIHRYGVDKVPEGVRALFDALSRHSPPPAASTLDVPAGDGHGGLMTFTAVSDRLGNSKRTVSRMVRDGVLVKAGRKITVASVATYEAGGR